MKIETVLEPAIPEHLRVERKLPLGAPAGFTPLHASYSARFNVNVKSIPMACLGIQYRNETPAVLQVLQKQRGQFTGTGAPSFWDAARYIDEAGCTNEVIVGYWDDLAVYEGWEKARPEDFWVCGLDLDGTIGAFKECYTPQIEDTETTFSHPHPEGYSKISDHMSGKTDTHEYWGSARDRIPRSQTDALAPMGYPSADPGDLRETLGRHIIVTPHENLCLLRSGQDWTETDEEETAFYLDKVKPFLDKGMIEIRDEGVEIGCYFNRYMTLMSDRTEVKKTYSLSAWHSLAEIEAWCKADTHLTIWGAGVRHYKKAGDAAKLRLYHEMSVIRAKDQTFEYFNCHNRTGMLNCVRSQSAI